MLQYPLWLQLKLLHLNLYPQPGRTSSLKQFLALPKLQSGERRWLWSRQKDISGVDPMAFFLSQLDVALDHCLIICLNSYRASIQFVLSYDNYER